MVLRKIIAPFLILLYLTAVIGLAFYNCHCEDSQRLALLAYNHCSCAHEAYDAHHAEGSCCGEASHSSTDVSCGAHANDNECCKIVYKSIKIDQENTSKQVKVPYNMSMFIALVSSVLTGSEAIHNIYLFNCSKSPPGSSGSELAIYQNCQLRL